MRIILVSTALLGALCWARPSGPSSGPSGPSGPALTRVKRGHEHSHHATSYQHFNLESYHPVPVYHHKHHEELSSHEPLHKSSDFELSGDLGSYGSHGDGGEGEGHLGHLGQLGHLSLSEGHESGGSLGLGEESYAHLSEDSDGEKEGHGY